MHQVELMTVDELSEMLHLSSSWLYDRKEEIGYFKLGGAVRFRLEDVLRWLASKYVQGNGKQRRATPPRLKHLRLS